MSATSSGWSSSARPARISERFSCSASACGTARRKRPRRACRRWRRARISGVPCRRGRRRRARRGGRARHRTRSPSETKMSSSRVKSGSSLPARLELPRKLQRELQRDVLLQQSRPCRWRRNRCRHGPGSMTTTGSPLFGAGVSSALGRAADRRGGRSVSAAACEGFRRGRNHVDDEPRRLVADGIEHEGVDDIDRPGEVEHDACPARARSGRSDSR